MPGGICNIFLNKVSPLVDPKRVVKGRLGNWMAVSLVNNEKRLEIINIYRIPSTSSNGVKCSLTQYIRIDGNVRTTTEYRKEIFEDIKKHIRENPDITDVLIGGDYNQYIGDRQVMKFHEEIGIHNIHQIVNNVELHQMGKTYIHGSKMIDAVYVMNGLMEYVEGCKLIGNNEIVEGDHRGYVIDIALEDYFEDDLGKWDGIDKVLLNLSKRSHREKFVEELERQLEIYDIEDDLDCMKISCLNKEIEKVDKLITQILNTATKKVEGMKRSIPYSYEKERIDRKSVV